MNVKGSQVKINIGDATISGTMSYFSVPQNLPNKVEGIDITHEYGPITCHMTPTKETVAMFRYIRFVLFYHRVAELPQELADEVGNTLLNHCIDKWWESKSVV